MYLLYNSFGFRGIYFFILIMSGLIAVAFFNNVLKSNNNLTISFVVSIIAMFFSRNVFAARNQIFSFLIFELEIYGLICLLEKGEKKFFLFLLLCSIVLLLVHDTVYPLFFVMMMPYLSDAILNRIFKFEDSFKFEKSNLKNIKYLVILIILSLIIGLFTPIFGTAYTNLINCMSGVSTSFINELQAVHPLQNKLLLSIIFLEIGLLAFTKAKFKIKDILFVLGFSIFAMIASRNMFFLFLIGLIYLTNMLTSVINTYISEEKKNNFFEKVESSKLLITVLSCFLLIISIQNFSNQFIKEYVHDLTYPVEATEWILNNIEYKDMRIWNHFNWGSYLELNGIKVFVDSRSGMYTVQENKDCTVLNDWYSVVTMKEDYNKILDKYNITHVLVNKNENLNKLISKDENYTIIYEDTLFALYQKNTNEVNN